MNRKILIPSGLVVVCVGLLWLGATRVMADADEKVVTEVAVQTGKITAATLHGYVQGYGTVETAPATADLPAAGALMGLVMLLSASVQASAGKAQRRSVSKSSSCMNAVSF